MGQLAKTDRIDAHVLAEFADRVPNFGSSRAEPLALTISDYGNLKATNSAGTRGVALPTARTRYWTAPSSI